MLPNPLVRFQHNHLRSPTKLACPQCPQGRSGCNQRPVCSRRHHTQCNKLFNSCPWIAIRLYSLSCKAVDQPRKGFPLTKELIRSEVHHHFASYCTNKGVNCPNMLIIFHVSLHIKYSSRCIVALVAFAGIRKPLQVSVSGVPMPCLRYTTLYSYTILS